MKILSWIAKLVPDSWKTSANNGIHNNGQSPPLNLKHYPELRDLKRDGANEEQLRACQRGFELLEEHGHAVDIQHVAEKCLPLILETQKATPEHLLVFFAVLTANMNHIPLNKQHAIGIARDISQAINRGLNDKQISTEVLSVYSS